MLFHAFNQDKKNAGEFRPAIDLYVVIENELGETVVFSWSEIFHTINPHQVLIALFNRADQVFPILAVPDNPMDGGHYRIFHPSDFYADRSVKSVAEIFFFQE